MRRLKQSTPFTILLLLAASLWVSAAMASSVTERAAPPGTGIFSRHFCQ
ncbi:hypothetical protein RVM26_14940 [Halomonas sp. KM072]